MKKLLRISLIVVVVVAGTLAFVGWKARQYLTPEALALALEDNVNSRVHIGEVKVSLFSIPARVVLKDVQFGVRDAEMSKPFVERAAMRGAPVQVGEVRLKVSLLPLTKRRLEVKELRFREPKISMMLFEKGGNSLDELFHSPDDDDDDEGEEGAEEESETLNISQLEIMADIKGVRIEKGEVNVVIEKTSLSLRIENLEMELDDLVIDPAKLAARPKAELDLSGVLLIDSSRQSRDRYGRLGFSGTAGTELFDPETGDLALVAAADLLLDDESFLGTNIPVVAKAWGGLQKLETVGVKIDPLPAKATFGRSKSLSVTYESGLITLNKTLSLILDEWELALREGAWIQTEKDTHDANAELVADAKFSAKAHRAMVKGADKLPKELGPTLVRKVEGEWFDNGRLRAKIHSDGSLSKPLLQVLNKLPDLKEMTEDALKNFARDGLQGLFGGKKKK